MKTFKCFKLFDVVALAILLCFAFLLLAMARHWSKTTHRFNAVKSTPYRYAIIQNNEMTACTRVDKETIEKLTSDENLRKLYFYKIATSVTEKFGVTVRNVEIRDDDEICVLYLHSSTKQISKDSGLARFY